MAPREKIPGLFILFALPFLHFPFLPSYFFRKHICNFKTEIGLQYLYHIFVNASQKYSFSDMIDLHILNRSVNFYETYVFYHIHTDFKIIF